jgi:hypothetical protein
MDKGKWFRASLRVSGDALQPDEIGSLLDLKPTKVHLKGEPRPGKSKLVWNNSLWLLQSPSSDDCEPAQHLEWLLNSLEPKAGIIKDIADRFRVELFCGFSSENGQGGFTLDAQMLQRIASLGIPFALDLYPPEGAAETIAEEEGQSVMPTVLTHRNDRDTSPPAGCCRDTGR